MAQRPQTVEFEAYDPVAFAGSGFQPGKVARRMYLSRSTVAKWWRRKLGATSWLFPRVCEMPSSVVVRCAP